MSEARRSSFKNWYARNGDDFNARRRKRYQENSEYRERAKGNSAVYRENIKSNGGGSFTMRDGFYTTVAVATILGISSQTLRNWEARDLIPKAIYGGKHRLYSQYQVDLLATLIVEASSDNFSTVRQELFSQWGNNG